jgi:hypothetical protein
MQFIGLEYLSWDHQISTNPNAQAGDYYLMVSFSVSFTCNLECPLSRQLRLNSREKSVCG